METSKFTQKYTIVQLFEEVPEGTEFPSSSWPLHATIVDVFAIDWDVPTMIARLEELLKVRMPIETVAEGDAFFGPHKQTQVTLLKNTGELALLHTDVLALLEEGGVKLNDPQYARSGFLAHSTDQKHARLQRAEKVTFDALTVIDMFPGADPYMRKVIKTIPLQGQPRTDESKRTNCCD